MFIGHFGVAFAAKRAAPRVSLGALFAAAQFADLLWPTLVLLGIEEVRVQPGVTVVTPLDFVSYPYSHSLVLLVVWGAAFGGAYVALRRARPSAGLAIAPLVVSHWFLDVLMHRPDMPLTPLPGSTRVGLGLWNSLPASLAVEFAVFAGGVAVYLGATRARARTRSIAAWTLVVTLAMIFLASTFGPPPPSAAAVAWSAEAMWLLVAWGWWADRSRSADAASRTDG